MSAVAISIDQSSNVPVSVEFPSKVIVASSEPNAEVSVAVQGQSVPPVYATSSQVIDILVQGQADKVIQASSPDLVHIQVFGGTALIGTSEPVLTLTADGVVNGYRVVRVFGGLAKLASRETDYGLRLGLSISAALDGNPVRATLQGIVTESSWSWVPGAIWWTDTGISQTPPVSGNIVRLGTALSQTSMFVHINQPIVRL